MDAVFDGCLQERNGFWRDQRDPKGRNALKAAFDMVDIAWH